MILVDSRIGSVDLAKRIPACLGAPTVELTTLEFGDLAFAGSGPDGDTLIGLEVKKIGDVIQCIVGGRFVGHQLPGLLATYGFSYLIVEGNYREGPDGVLEVPWGAGWGQIASGFTVEKLNNWLTTVQELAGIRIRQTYKRRDTAALAVSLYHWYQKPWTEHKSLNVIYNPPAGPRGVQLGPHHEPTPVERVASTMPGVKWMRAQAIGKKFSTVKEMVDAPEESWLEIDGIGKGTMRNARKYLGVGE